jgi:hypothetical protein
MAKYEFKKIMNLKVMPKDCNEYVEQMIPKLLGKYGIDTTKIQEMLTLAREQKCNTAKEHGPAFVLNKETGDMIFTATFNQGVCRYFTLPYNFEDDKVKCVLPNSFQNKTVNFKPDRKQWDAKKVNESERGRLKNDEVEKFAKEVAKGTLEDIKEKELA